MKPFIKKFVLVLVTISALVTTASAQKKKKTQAEFNLAMSENVHAKIKNAVKEKPDDKAEATAKKQAAAAFQTVNEDLVTEATNKIENYSRESKKAAKESEDAYLYKPNDLNLIPLIEDAPTPITALPTAAATDVEARYQPYVDKIKSQQKQFRDMALKHSKMQDVYNKEGKEGMEKRATAEVNKNPMIQQMGGMDKIKNMTPEERNAMASKMKADIKNNPSMLTGGGNAASNAMAKKMLDDKEYAKKVNNMSEADRQAEITKYMLANPDAFDPAKNAERRSDPKEVADLKKTQELEKLLGRTLQRLQAAATRYGNSKHEAELSINEMKDRVAKWASARMESIPVVELGEYGHDKDPIQVKALEMTSKVSYYNIAVQEVAMRGMCWTYYKNECKSALLEFNNFIGEYKWGQGDASQFFKGTYNEPKINEAVNGVYELMLDLSSESKGITHTAWGAQKVFDETL